MPGSIQPAWDTTYRIDSDLPEIFLSTGVLYATVPVLPPFNTKAGEPVIEAQRTQRNNGFTTINDNFEVFLYHMSNPGEEPRSRRVVVYVRNVGEEAVDLMAKQIMEADGKMGKVDGPEGRLGIRALDLNAWSTVSPNSNHIAPGNGAAIGWSPRLSNDAYDDATKSSFFTGIVRVEVGSLAFVSAGAVESEGLTKQRQKQIDATNLQVYVIAVSSEVPVNELSEACEALINKGAHSGEGAMDINIAPPPCHVRRVVGVSKNFLWQSENVVLNADALTTEGIAFQMAAPKVQTVGCEIARQTQDMLLHPPYVHADTVGNYMQEYLIHLTLDNPGTESRTVDVRFGKQDASIGLAWQVAVADYPKKTIMMMNSENQIHTNWAGAWTTDDLPDNTRSFFEGSPELGPVTLAPGENRTVTLRLLPLASSSLPFQIHVMEVEE